MSEPQDKPQKLPSDEKLYAGKYKSEDELAKGILELAKKKTGNLEEFYKNLEKEAFKSPESSSNGNSEPPPPENPLTIPDDILAKSEQEFFTNGELSPETKKKLLEGTFSNEKIMETYFQGLNSKATDFKKSLFDVAGGEQAYKALIEWGKINLTEDEIKFFNTALSSGDKAQAGLAVEAVKARYQAKGNTINIIEQGQVPQSTVQGYNSKAEMARDMSDPRYDTDEAYRKAVEEKLKKTTAF
jgi:hypothetical protein